MVIKSNSDKLQNGILEYEGNFKAVNEKQSYAFISVPYKAVKSLNWNKATKLKITIEEVNK